MIWCVYVGGKGDIMNFYFYRFLNLKFKQKDKMPKEWDMIVDQVDDDALCALTVAYTIERLFPATGSIIRGLNILENVFSKLCYTN